MGVQGAAVATVISQGVSVVFCILYIFLRVKILLPEKQHFRVGSHLYWELFSQSISKMCIRDRKVLPLFSSVIELVGKVVFVLFFIPKFAYNAVILCEPIICLLYTSRCV